MPRLRMMAGRGVASVRPRGFRRVLRGVAAVVTAVVVVGGGLWVAVPTADRYVRVPAEVLYGATLEEVRPSRTGYVDPKLGAAVDALLARRGIAVRTNNLQLFLRDVATELWPKQRQLFQNLRELQMVVTYRRAEPWTNYGAVRRYGPATGTFRVSMRYQLAGTRLAQAATDVGYTFTVRGNRLYLVDDNDLAEAIGSGRMPWNYGPIDMVRRSNVLVIVNQGRLAYAEKVADQTVQVAQMIRRQIWRGPLQPVPLVVAMREPGVLMNLPPTVPGDEPARIQSLSSPAADGRPVGGWLVIRPKAQPTFDSAQLAHALVHLVPVRLGDEAPRWLVEGLAMFAEKRQLTLTGRGGAVAEHRKLVRDNSLSDLVRLPEDDEFTTAESEDISWLAVEHLASKVGLEAVTDFYLQVARRGYSEFAKERLLVEYTGLTRADLVESLRSVAG